MNFEVVAKDIKTIQAQNNYTNIVLQSMCSQLNRIEINLDSKASCFKYVEKRKSINSLFKPYNPNMAPQIGNEYLPTEAKVLQELATQISKLSSSSNNINTSDELEFQFIEDKIPIINKLRGQKNQ